MTGEQIITLYESDPSITTEDLCSAFPGLEPETIKNTLLSGSQLYRERLKTGNEVYNKSDFDAARQVTLHLMHNAENEMVRARMALRIQDEHLGRINAKINSKKNTIINNVTIFNEHFKKAQEAKRIAGEKIIDVAAEHQHLKELAI